MRFIITLRVNVRKFGRLLPLNYQYECRLQFTKHCRLAAKILPLGFTTTVLKPTKENSLNFLLFHGFIFRRLGF